MILTFRMPSEKVRKLLKLLIKIIITALCIWYISHKIDVKKLSGVLVVADPLWIVLSICAFLFSKLLSSIRLNIYFRNIDIYLPEWKNIQLYWLGMFYNLFLPGSISGDAYKVVRLTKDYNVAYKKTTAAVLLDRFSGLLALGLLLGIFWIIAFKGGYYSAWLMAGILLAIPVFYFLIKIFFPYFVPGFFPTFAWGGWCTALPGDVYVLHSAGPAHTRSHRKLYAHIFNFIGCSRVAFYHWRSRRPGSCFLMGRPHFWIG